MSHLKFSFSTQIGDLPLEITFSFGHQIEPLGRVIALTDSELSNRLLYNLYLQAANEERDCGVITKESNLSIYYINKSYFSFFNNSCYLIWKNRLLKEQLVNSVLYFGFDFSFSDFEDSEDFVEFIWDNQNKAHQLKIIILICELLTDLKSANNLIIIENMEDQLSIDWQLKLISWLSAFLVKNNLYCLLTTNSPSILQQIPSAYVKILFAEEYKISVTQPEEETFGNSYDVIASLISEETSRKKIRNQRLSYQILEKLSSEYSRDEIVNFFPNGLSLLAATELNYLYSRKEEK